MIRGSKMFLLAFAAAVMAGCATTGAAIEAGSGETHDEVEQLKAEHKKEIERLRARHNREIDELRARQSDETEELRALRKQDRIARANIDIMRIMIAALRHHMDHGWFPATYEGINHLVTEGYLPAPPRDPWDNAYVYRFPGLFNPEMPDVGSYGADRSPGGEGEDAEFFFGQF